MTKYFQIQELVDKPTYDLLGESAWMVLDRRLVQALDPLRAKIGKPVLVNSYKKGLSNRGYRSHLSEVGGDWSQHRMGRAIDFSVIGWSIEELHDWVRSNLDFLHNIGFTAYESLNHTPTWVHLDTRLIPNGIHMGKLWEVRL